MFGLSWFVRKRAEAPKTVDLGDFLASIDEAASTREAVPNGPTSLERDESMDERSRKLDSGPVSARAVAPSEPPRLDTDERLDEALTETFPASDPIAVSPA
jgi:hypothetical protein